MAAGGQKRERPAGGEDEGKASSQSHTWLTREKPSAGGLSSAGGTVPPVSGRCGVQVQSPQGRGADEVGGFVHTEESTCVLSVSDQSACPQSVRCQEQWKGIGLDEIPGGVLGLPLPSCDLKKPFCP